MPMIMLILRLALKHLRKVCMAKLYLVIYPGPVSARKFRGEKMKTKRLIDDDDDDDDELISLIHRKQFTI